MSKKTATEFQAWMEGLSDEAGGRVLLRFRKYALRWPLTVKERLAEGVAEDADLQWPPRPRSAEEEQRDAAHAAAVEQREAAKAALHEAMHELALARGRMVGVLSPRDLAELDRLRRGVMARHEEFDRALTAEGRAQRARLQPDGPIPAEAFPLFGVLRQP